MSIKTCKIWRSASERFTKGNYAVFLINTRWSRSHSRFDSLIPSVVTMHASVKHHRLRFVFGQHIIYILNSRPWRWSRIVQTVNHEYDSINFMTHDFLFSHCTLVHEMKFKLYVVCETTRSVAKTVVRIRRSQSTDQTQSLTRTYVEIVLSQLFFFYLITRLMISSQLIDIDMSHGDLSKSYFENWKCNAVDAIWMPRKNAYKQKKILQLYIER